MKRQWEPEELNEQWTLLPIDQALLANKTDTATEVCAECWKGILRRQA
jgi:hypothetical protein